MEEIKSGLEIHQQLDTGKLFCRCPSILRNDEPIKEIKRKMHAVAGESGEIDAAARHEVSQDKEFIYQFYDTNCLVELDECPPMEIDKEALQVALHISLLLNCEILPITQIMRKTVVNGSNTSGFQRTVLIGRNGFVETKTGKVRIATIFLEEDAARIVEKKENTSIFRLDRLGIPLVEIATEPDIKTPEQAKKVALHIGDVLRSCKVKRGIGTIRQDINVSIPGHPRIEIKGFQDVKMFVPTILKEVERQKENLKLKKDLKSEVRNANPDGTSTFLRPMPGSARMYPETDLPLLKISRDIINKAKATLPKLRSDKRKELSAKGLSEEMIKLLIAEEKVQEFEALLKIIPEPNFIVKAMILIPKEITSHEKIKNIDEVLTLDIIESVVNKVANKEIKKEDVKHVLTDIAKGKSFEEAVKIEKAEISDVETEIAKLVKEKPGLSVAGYMGLIMAKFKGKISGKEVSEILNKLVKK